jgi:hypothetical protein
MSKHSKMNFGSLRSAGSASQGRGEPSFEPRDRTLDLHPLAVLELGKTAVHLASIFGLGPATSAPLVQVDDRAANAQCLSGIRMIVLGIVTGVGQHAVEVHPLAGAAQHRSQKRRILRRSVVHQRVNQQVRRVVTGQRQLGPATKAIAFLPASVGIMCRTVSRLHARGVDAGLLFAADHFPLDSVGKDRIEQFMEQTFLRRRCCAL